MGPTTSAPSSEPSWVPAASAAALQAALQMLSGKRALVVADNEFNLEVAVSLLQEARMQVQVARDGAQALAALQGQPCDCVLMDVQMPVMDGLEATRRIRSSADLSALVVIAVTANAGPNDRSQCLLAGMNAVLTKPIEPELLFVTMAHWMRGPVAGGSPGPDAVAPQPSAAPELPVWDDTALARIIGDNPAVQARLLDKFRNTAREHIAALQLSAAQAQWEAAADLAHKLKSSARSVGALRLGQCCEMLERQGRAGNAADCPALAQAVLAAHAEVEARLSL